MSEKPKQDNDPALVELSARHGTGAIVVGYAIASVAAVGVFASCLGFTVASAAGAEAAMQITGTALTFWLLGVPFGLTLAAVAHICRWWVQTDSPNTTCP